MENVKFALEERVLILPLKSVQVAATIRFKKEANASVSQVLDC